MDSSDYYNVQTSCDESIPIQASDSPRLINKVANNSEQVKHQYLTEDFFGKILSREKGNETNKNQSSNKAEVDACNLKALESPIQARPRDLDLEKNLLIPNTSDDFFSEDKTGDCSTQKVESSKSGFLRDSVPNYQGNNTALLPEPSFSGSTTGGYINSTMLDEVFELLSTNSKAAETPAKNSITQNTTKDFTSVLPKVPARSKCTDCLNEYNSACRQHNCQLCKQRVGGYNALLCQICGSAHHIACMTPPLLNLYRNHWHCQTCKPNRVVSSNGYSLYVGKVPGILVGASWKYRMQLNYVCLHRPNVAGIHGAFKMPAYSIVLQGGYDKDDDLGVDFYYTGAGGRDEKGVHAKNQELKSSNLSLASSCDADLNFEGATAHDWTKSTPIRVIRGAKLHKYKSQYAPNNFRYDGIYKLVRYWKEKIPEGFDIWRFHLRRDDIEPAPWTPEGEQYIIDNNILFEYSDPIKTVPKISGASPKHLSKKLTLVPKAPARLNEKKIAKSKPKSSLIPSQVSEWVAESFATAKDAPRSLHFLEKEEVSMLSTGHETSHFGLLTTLNPFIIRDIRNQKLWSDICPDKTQTVPQFLDKVRHSFECAVCFDLVESSYPCTTVCGHNFCRACFRATTRQNMEVCPVCKNHLPKDCTEGSDPSLQTITNHALADILLVLKPAIDDLRDQL